MQNIADLERRVGALYPLSDQITPKRVVCYLMIAKHGPKVEAVQMATSEADIRYWAHSDFGRAFRIFLDRYPDAITSRTTVIILGDGRSNFYDPQIEALQTIHRQAKRVLWLNPESRWGWGSGDSIVDLYATECDVMEECRNLEQLTSIMKMMTADA